MLVVYVAGPFRGKNHWEIEQNIRRAETLALELWRKGVAVVCPHTNTRFFDGAAPDEVWLNGDLEIMRRCDAVFMTEQWSTSEGAKAERAEAQRLGIPVFDCYLGSTEFANWIKTATMVQARARGTGV